MDSMGYDHMTGGVLQEYQYPQAFELESPSEGTAQAVFIYIILLGQCGPFPTGISTQCVVSKMNGTYVDIHKCTLNFVMH